MTSSTGPLHAAVVGMATAASGWGWDGERWSGSTWGVDNCTNHRTRHGTVTEQLQNGIQWTTDNRLLQWFNCIVVTMWHQRNYNEMIIQVKKSYSFSRRLDTQLACHHMDEVCNQHIHSWIQINYKQIISAYITQSSSVKTAPFMMEMNDKWKWSHNTLMALIDGTHLLFIYSANQSF